MDRYGGGDDLDDDFVPDDLVAFSDEEEGGHSADGDDVNALLSADEGTSEAAEALKAQEAAQEKKRKRKAKDKERKAKVRTAASRSPASAELYQPGTETTGG